MRHYLEKKDEIFSLLKDTENYIILNDGKAIRQNIVNNNDDIWEVVVDDKFSCEDVCGRKRPKYEEEIITKSVFTNTIHIYKDVELKVIFLTDEEKYLNVVFDIEEKVKADITFIYLSVDCFLTSLVEVNCREGSNVKYTSIITSVSEVKEYFNSYLDDKAYLNLNTLNVNEKEANNLSNIYLYRRFAKVDINNTIINASQVSQTYSFNVHHLKGDTSSNMMCYAVCKKDSIININTDGIIKKACSKSVVNQKCKGVILDLNSQISASPILEIDEYDVVANHGASIGAIDDEDLYYLMTRGLTKEMSSSLIVLAYVDPFRKSITNEDIKKFVDKVLNKNL